MPDVLTSIIERKRGEVANRLGDKQFDASPSNRSLRISLARPGARFIMEVKRRSPSGHRSAVTVEEAVAAYAPVADAISVLIDGPAFGGSLDDLRFVRRHFDGPILAKDFIVDPTQVSEARAAGADAVLVMMSVLDDVSAAATLTEARRLNMDAIVEVHDEVELSRALGLGATIIGINNRNLKTLAIDLGVSERLAPLVPDDVLVIAESGIRDRPDVDRLSSYADAFLVGSSLMAAGNIVEAARSLVHGRVKMCGLTREGDVAIAAAAGATHAGFVMVPGTRRAVDESLAIRLARAAREAGMKSVGVFRDAPAPDVVKTVETVGFDVVQLHGKEDGAAIKAIRCRVPDRTEIWALCGVTDKVAPVRAGADRSLFDTVCNGSSGGTGREFDWNMLKGRGDLPDAFIAGGIGPANARAAASMGAHGIDVGSGVEAAPGIKDAAKIETLFAALRPTARSDA